MSDGRELIQMSRRSFGLRKPGLCRDDPSEVIRLLESAGIPARRARLGLHEGRGVVLLEFGYDVSSGVVALVLEAESRQDLIAQVGHVFRVKKTVYLPAKEASITSEPYQLDPGDQIIIQGYDDTEKYYIAIVSGVHRDRMSELTFQQWSRMESSFELVGELDAKTASGISGDSAKVSKDDESSKRKKPVNGTYMTVNRNLANFPRRKSFDSYLSKFMKDLLNKKKEAEEAERQAQLAQAEAAVGGEEVEGMDVGAGRPTSGPNFFGR